MKTKFLLVLTALIAGLAGWTIANGSFRLPAAHAAEAYSLGSVKGTYGYVVQGQMGVNNPLIALGVMVADGNGGISGSETVQAFGVGVDTEPRIFQGSYTVNKDGTGTITVNFPAGATDPSNPDIAPTPGATVRYRFVIVTSKLILKAVRADNRTFATAEFSLQ